MADSTAAATKPSSSVKLVLLGEAAVGKVHPPPSPPPAPPWRYLLQQLTLSHVDLQSSLVLRFVNNDFQENKEPTIGGRYPSSATPPPRLPRYGNLPPSSSLTNAAFLTQKCNLPHRTIKFEIWDTAGQERFASLAPMYYRNAQSALVVYDITKPTSLVKARHWVAELQRQANPGIVIALVGNKLDLSSSADSTASSTGDNTNPSTETDGEAEGDTPAEDATTEGDARKVSTKEGREYAEEEGLLFFETSAKSGHNVQEVFTAIANAIPETQMKNVRGSGAAGAAQSALGGGNERVNLTGPRGEAGAKEGCAC
ncbi:MAG: hypothetical protein Q9201_003340 [Fulgogasparrea decipioides]